MRHRKGPELLIFWPSLQLQILKYSNKSTQEKNQSRLLYKMRVYGGCEKIVKLMKSLGYFWRQCVRIKYYWNCNERHGHTLGLKLNHVSKRGPGSLDHEGEIDVFVWFKSMIKYSNCNWTYPSKLITFAALSVSSYQIRCKATQNIVSLNANDYWLIEWSKNDIQSV